MHHSFSDDIVSVTNLRKDLPSMLERVRGGVPITIMQGDRADLAIVKRADLAARDAETKALRDQLAALAGELETLEILADRSLLDSIQDGLDDLRMGRVIALADLGEPE